MAGEAGTDCDELFFFFFCRAFSALLRLACFSFLVLLKSFPSSSFPLFKEKDRGEGICSNSTSKVAAFLASAFFFISFRTSCWWIGVADFSPYLRPFSWTFSDLGDCSCLCSFLPVLVFPAFSPGMLLKDAPRPNRSSREVEPFYYNVDGTPATKKRWVCY